MKSLIRAMFINGLVLYVVMLVYPGLVYDGRFVTLLFGAMALTLLNKIVKPLIKLLLLPINLITLGLFGWVSHVATLLLMMKVVSGFRVQAFDFTGLSWNGFTVPAMHINVFVSVILASVFLSLVRSLIRWVLSKN